MAGLGHIQLPAHATRTRGRRDIRGDSDHLVLAPVSLRHGLADGDALSTSPDGVRGVLDIGARHYGAIGSEQGTADPEVAVRAVGHRLGFDGFCEQRLEVVELDVIVPACCC